MNICTECRYSREWRHFFVPICASCFVTFAEDNFRTFPTGKGIVFGITT
nr:MAG TPA: hypothetical protein [Caudoviricetes sp.]